MATFPYLKSGAVAQYPSSQARVFATRVLRFVDGSEQRWAEQSSPQRRWVIRLDQLDEEEVWRIQAFVQGLSGRSGVFTFVDPWDGIEHENCSLEHDVTTLELTSENIGRTRLIVLENRN